MTTLSLLYASTVSAVAVLLFAVACGLLLHMIERGALRLWRRYQRG